MIVQPTLKGVGAQRFLWNKGVLRGYLLNDLRAKAFMNSHQADCSTHKHVFSTMQVCAVVKPTLKGLGVQRADYAFIRLFPFEREILKTFLSFREASLLCKCIAC